MSCDRWTKNIQNWENSWKAWKQFSANCWSLIIKKYGCKHDVYKVFSLEQYHYLVSLKKKTNMKKLNWLVNCLIKISCIVDPKKHELQNQPLLSPGKLCWSKVFLSINELYWWLYKSYFMEQLPNSINSWVNIQRSLVNIMETSYPSYW